MRLLMISDTHLPRRARDLPRAVWVEIDKADVVVHAGDWCNIEAFEAVQSRARRLVAVYGNNDEPELVARLPEVARAELGGLRFAVVHDTGQAKGRDERCARRFTDADVLVFGHSHIPWDSTTSSGLRLLNPGSPTDRRRQPYCTYLTAELRDSRLQDVSLHPIIQR